MGSILQRSSPIPVFQYGTVKNLDALLQLSVSIVAVAGGVTMSSVQHITLGAGLSSESALRGNFASQPRQALGTSSITTHSSLVFFSLRMTPNHLSQDVSIMAAIFSNKLAAE